MHALGFSKIPSKVPTTPLTENPMTRFLALATLPSGRFAYVPVKATDRDDALRAVSPDTKVHAILTEDQVQAALQTLDLLPEPVAPAARKYVVIMIMRDGRGVVRGSEATSAMEARKLVNQLTLDEEGQAPAVNLGAFEYSHVLAMRRALTTGLTQLHEDLTV